MSWLRRLRRSRSDESRDIPFSPEDVEDEFIGEDTGIQWASVWQDVAMALAKHVDAGRRHLLTEEVLRFESVKALERRGVEPGRIAFEHRILGVGPLDLVVDVPSISAAVEFKFPRDPQGRNAPDTMTFGELLNDFYRLAKLEVPERWAVQVIARRLGDYLGRRTELRWTTIRGDMLDLAVGLPEALPRTARVAAPAALEDLGVRALCVDAHIIDDMTLAAYRIEPKD